MLLYILICGPLILFSIAIWTIGRFNGLAWSFEHWYFILLMGIGVALPLGMLILVRYIIIEHGEAIRFYYFPFTTNWDKAANNIDVNYNQNVFISEVKDVEIVKLTKEEKADKSLL